MPAPDPPASRRFVALVPVKPPALGKSRLAGLPGHVRRDLAEAFAEDTVAAALATRAMERVLVVTDDSRFARHLGTALSCDVIPDGVGGDLNGTLVQAAREATRRWPDLTPVALCADLPALRADDLGSALDAWRPDAPGFVTDEAGTGTTLFVADPPGFAPRFGESSRTAHLAGGAREIPGALRTLRRDVDDVTDLGRAMLLGVGPQTAAVWGRDQGRSPAPG